MATYDELFLSIYRTNRLFQRAYTQVLDEFELTYLQHMCLVIIHKRREAKLMDIGHVLDLSSNTLTPVIEKLVAKKWLIKARSQNDQRINVLKIAPYKAVEMQAMLTAVDDMREALITRLDKPLDLLLAENQKLNQTIADLMAEKRGEK